jgi:hypothetical protein
LVATVDQTSNKQDTGQLGSSKEVGRDGTPETEETIHTHVGKDQNNHERKELKE